MDLEAAIKELTTEPQVSDDCLKTIAESSLESLKKAVRDNSVFTEYAIANHADLLLRIANMIYENRK